MRTLSLMGGLAALLCTLSAAAQDAAPTGIRGTIERLDGHTLVVDARDGRQVSIALPPNVVVAAVVKRSLADIKAGDYVASTSIRGTDGRLHALEVHIFPEAMRGAGEGQRPWDLAPASLMTNATVAGIAATPQGQALKVTYKGGEAEVIVGPDVPVVGLVPGDVGLLAPGRTVFALAAKKPDGTLAAARVTVEKDGVKPPM